MIGLRGKLLRRLARDEDGVTAVEFGILAIPLIVLLIGFVAFLLLRYFPGPLFGIDLLIKS